MPSYSVRSAVARPGESAGSPVSATLTFTDADGFVSCDPAPPIQFDLAELTGAEPSDGELRLTLGSGLSVRLTGMGKMAEELVEKLAAARRDRTAYAFRFGRPVGGNWDAGEVAAPGETAPRRAGVRLFGSLLGIVPDRGEPLALPYGDMRGIAFDESAHQLAVEAAGGGVWRIGRLARRTAPFLEELKRTRRELIALYQAQLKDVMPHIPELELQQLSGEWREGIAVPAQTLEARSPGTAARLLAFLPSEERRTFVAGLAALFRDPPRLGFYYSEERAGEAVRRPFEPFALFQKPVTAGFAAVWEVLGETGTATYVFRGAEPDLAERIGGALRSIRFAREPVYLSEAELRTTGEHRQYVPLLGRSNELKFLKARFAGRVPHVEPETYAARVAALCDAGGSK